MKLVQKRSRKSGLPPGTLVHIGEKKAETVTMTAFNYSGARCEERTVTKPEELQPPSDESVTWVDIGGVHKLDLLEAFGKRFSLHPLLLEDIANTDQRPKLEDYNTYFFLVMKVLLLTDRQEVLVEQVSFVLDRTVCCRFKRTARMCSSRCGTGCGAGKAACGRTAPTICSMRWWM